MNNSNSSELILIEDQDLRHQRTINEQLNGNSIIDDSGGGVGGGGSGLAGDNSTLLDGSVANGYSYPMTSPHSSAGSNRFAKNTISGNSGSKNPRNKLNSGNGSVGGDNPNYRPDSKTTIQNIQINHKNLNDSSGGSSSNNNNNKMNQVNSAAGSNPDQITSITSTNTKTNTNNNNDNNNEPTANTEDVYGFNSIYTGYNLNQSNSANNGSNLCAFLLTMVSVTLIVGTLPFSLFLCIKVVQEYERAVIFRLGRLVKGGAKGPGIFFIIPCIDSYSKVDLRTVSFDVPPQEILSRDSVTVSVDAVVYFRISNATVAVSNVEDYGRSTRLLAATTLRNVLGTKDLSQLLSERETISHIMQSSLDEATDPWGVKVERVEIKDVRLPVQLQRAMAAEAEAAREARAKVIAAEGEQRASRALKEAAEVMSGNSAALQLRYLQTLNSIAAEKNSTIVFPIPLEMFRGFMSKPAKQITD